MWGVGLFRRSFERLRLSDCGRARSTDATYLSVVVFTISEDKLRLFFFWEADAQIDGSWYTSLLSWKIERLLMASKSGCAYCDLFLFLLILWSLWWSRDGSAAELFASICGLTSQTIDYSLSLLALATRCEAKPRVLLSTAGTPPVPLTITVLSA